MTNIFNRTALPLATIETSVYINKTLCNKSIKYPKQKKKYRNESIPVDQMEICHVLNCVDKRLVSSFQPTQWMNNRNKNTKSYRAEEDDDDDEYKLMELDKS